jgi:hypothetical protein
MSMIWTGIGPEEEEGAVSAGVGASETFAEGSFRKSSTTPRFRTVVIVKAVP